MTTTTEQKQESKIQPGDYSCEILLEKTTEDKATDRSFPTDAYLVSEDWTSALSSVPYTYTSA